ncbi:hypothetical protein H4R34_000620 [Dimargaris verticillata]|uniref:DUF4211 domain-containing protein n=1 Tax=Dimargaris verticillata TaxID=2761393 RepID=A0A9W8EB34_9FUNG|nr:hypothetical protein H4R34_000620 [Dimargaris verticillata]
MPAHSRRVTRSMAASVKPPDAKPAVHTTFEPNTLPQAPVVYIEVPPTPRQHRTSKRYVLESSDDEAGCSLPPLLPPATPSDHSQSNPTSPTSLVSETSSPSASSPLGRRRLIMRKRPAPARDAVTEFDDELANLDPDAIIEGPRTRKIVKRSTIRERLAQSGLQRHMATDSPAAVESAPQNNPSQQSLGDTGVSDSEVEALSIYTESLPGTQQKLLTDFQKLPQPATTQNSSAVNSAAVLEVATDSDEDSLNNFIIQDDIESDGVDIQPAMSHRSPRPRSNSNRAELPLEFSGAHTWDLRINCKIVCQYFVHLIVSRSRLLDVTVESLQYFTIAYEAVDRKIQSLKDSIISSTAWVPRFRHDLETLPIYHSKRCDIDAECEACHFSNRHATVKVVLAGTPYEHKSSSKLVLAALTANGGLENYPKAPDTAQSSAASGNSDCSDSESHASGDDTSQITQYFVGRTCHARSQLFHEMHHFYYGVSCQLISQVCKLINQLKWPPERLEQDSVNNAEMLFDKLEQQGHIDWVYHNLQQLLDQAEGFGHVA